MDSSNLVAGDIEDMGIIWDSSCPGLGLRRNKRGKVWILKYRVNNRQIMKVLGPADILNRDEARALAKTAKWDAKQGKLPEPKRRVAQVSVERFCHEYMDRYAKPCKQSWLKDRQRIDFHIIKHWGKRRLGDLQQTDVANLHSLIGKTAPVSANRLLEQLHKMFKLAKQWGYLAAGSANPAAGIDRYPEKKTTRSLSKKELERLAPHINNLPKNRRAYFWLLIFTGCRKSEILELKWSGVDLDGGYIYIRDRKNGEDLELPLPQKAIELLAELAQRSDYVFPGRAGTYWKRPDKVWWKIREAAGLPDVKLHHLRHTVASRLLKKKYPLKTIGEVLGQKSLQSTNKYAHMANEHLREVLEDHVSDLPDAISA